MTAEITRTRALHVQAISLALRLAHDNAPMRLRVKANRRCSRLAGKLYQLERQP